MTRTIQPKKIEAIRKLQGQSLLTKDLKTIMGERSRELRRRRKRKISVAAIKKRAAKASASEKEVLANKLRKLSPGAELIIAELKLIKAK